MSKDTQKPENKTTTQEIIDRIMGKTPSPKPADQPQGGTAGRRPNQEE